MCIKYAFEYVCLLHRNNVSGCLLFKAVPLGVLLVVHFTQ